MIFGRFGDTSGRPYIEGRFVLPSQSLFTNISFLMDTGADQTVIMPADAAKMGVDFDQITDRGRSAGVGGMVEDLMAPANLVFLGSSGKLYVYETPVRFMYPNPEIADLPSLLGRDIIDCWRTVYSPEDNMLQSEVIKASQVIDQAQLTP